MWWRRCGALCAGEWAPVVWLVDAEFAGEDARWRQAGKRTLPKLDRKCSDVRAPVTESAIME